MAGALGRLLGFAFRQPTLQIRIAFVDGSSETYRFVPAMAERGFVLSPLPTSAPGGLSDPAPLFTPDRASAGFAHVGGFTIFGSTSARWSFGRGEIEMRSVRFGP